VAPPSSILQSAPILGEAPASLVSQSLGYRFDGRDSLVNVLRPTRDGQLEALAVAGYDFIGQAVVGPQAERFIIRLRTWSVGGGSLSQVGSGLISSVEVQSVGMPDVFIGTTRRERADVLLPDGVVGVRFVDRTAGLKVTATRSNGRFGGTVELSRFAGDGTNTTRSTFTAPPGLPGFVRVLDATLQSADLAASLKGVGLTVAGEFTRLTVEVAIRSHGPAPLTWRSNRSCSRPRSTPS